MLECQIDYAMEQMGANETCTPWYLPVLDEELKICDPWNAVKFRKFMSVKTSYECGHCLSDCEVGSTYN